MMFNKSALASLAHEGKKPSQEGLKITSKFLEGKISSKKAIEKIINSYKK